jgi:hypothetical protein
MRNELLAKVRDRIDRYSDRADSRAVLEEQALIEAGQLLDLAIQPIVETGDLDLDTELLIAIAWLHMCRDHAVPRRRRDKYDTNLTVGLFAVVANVYPQYLPPSVNGLVGRNAQTPPEPHQLMNDSAGQLVTQFGRTGNRAALNQAIELYRRALEVISPGHSDHPGIQTNLGAALTLRSQHTG